MAPPAAVTVLRVAATRPRLLRIVALLALLLVSVPLLVIVAVLAWFSSATERADPPAWIGPAIGVPLQYVPLYQEAGRIFRVNPFLLAAIHKHETSYSSNPDTYRINFAGCCIGAMQLNVADGTWERVRNAYRRGPRPAQYPHAAEPHPTPTDDFDSIMAAAELLRIKARGEPLPALDARAWRAARAYAGAGSEAARYADQVLALARDLQRAASASPPAATNLAWPVPAGTPITSRFCERRPWEACHPGIDLGVPAGTPISAAAAGEVTVAADVAGYGKFICIRHAVHLGTCYAHLARFAAGLHVGAFVRGGQVIAWSGCTGLCFGPHLHFEVRLGGAPPAPVVDPLLYLEA